MENCEFGERIVITINNPCQLKIHPEKQIAMVLGLSRSQVKSLLEKGEIGLKAEVPQTVTFSVNACRI